MNFFKEILSVLLGVFIFAMLSPLVFIKLVLPYIRKVIQKKNKLLFKRFIEVKLFFSFGFILFKGLWWN